ncbi:MAG TPA: GGDEF domain-containing phosphodiesterase, partial [Chloroflexota bacterium]|nr:GGDEF domain-containing phosphodiesterase [Chloroflexota bacterium]
AAVRKLLHSLEAPCTIDGYSVDLEASIGIAVSPEHGHDARTLLRHADVAMYIAKADRTGYAVYAPNQDRHTTDRLGLVAELRNAIDAEQLFLHYQPKVDCRTGDVSGVEALVRWQHPQRGTIAPDQFIPLAEETGLIDPLTRWVLGEALRQSRAWQRNGLALPIAINLSMRNLQDPQLAQVVADLLALSDVPPSWLTLEITETAVMADPVRALAVLDQLRRTGVRIAIDDFGTGHTSLAYLRQIPADELKIDRSFIGSVLTDASGRAIVRSTIELSHSLALRVVAEGVEDEPTWRALAALGCDESQGYYLTRPLAPDALITWLRERRTPTTAAA